MSVKIHLVKHEKERQKVTLKKGRREVMIRKKKS